MRYKLIASDVDGTLLNSKSELTERTKRAIVRAVEAGVLFVTATGRPFSNVEVFKKLFNGISSDVNTDMPFIVFNGAAAYMGKSGKLLFEKFLDFDLAKEAFEIGQKLDVAQIVWTGSRLWANRRCKETIRYQNYHTDLKMSIVTEFDAIKSEVKGISKVLWITDPVEVTRLRHKMVAHFGERLNCVSSMSYFLEFVSRDAGKGTALAEIGRLYGITKSEMIAVGDSYNDICMIKYAGLGVAVENAPDDIKAICDHVTSSNNCDGVAELIEKCILSNCPE